MTLRGISGQTLSPAGQIEQFLTQGSDVFWGNSRGFLAEEFDPHPRAIREINRLVQNDGPVFDVSLKDHMHHLSSIEIHCFTGTKPLSVMVRIDSTPALPSRTAALAIVSQRHIFCRRGSLLSRIICVVFLPLTGQVDHVGSSV